MSIVLFAILGATLKMGTAYWICFGCFCFIKVCNLVDAISKACKKHLD